MQLDSIIISTVDREPEYIHQTLACLLFTLKEKKEIYLVVDGPSYKSYEIYKNYCKFHFNENKETIPYKKAKNNYVRCLELSKFLGGINLIMEDDILLYCDWYEKFKSFDFPKEECIFSLNSIQNLNSKVGYEEFISKEINGARMVWNKPFGVIYTPKVLELLINSLKANEINLPHDMMIGYIAFYKKIKVYECVPSLVEHIGEISHINPDMLWTTKKVNGTTVYQIVHRSDGSEAGRSFSCK